MQDPKSALTNVLAKINNDRSPQKSNIDISISIEIERDLHDDESDTDHSSDNTENQLTQCVLPHSVIKEETLKLMQHTKSIPDKIIEMSIRNHWGTYVQPTHEDYDISINRAIIIYKNWYSQSKVREAILAYKCYVCNVGWWKLAPFREHIREHKDIKVTIEPFHHECCMVAFYGELGTVHDVTIFGQCHVCLRTAKEHEDLKHRGTYYVCIGCKSRFFTCGSIFYHEGKCGRFQSLVLQDSILNEYSVCTICQVNCLTQKRFDQHMILKHSVHSDVPVPYNWPAPKYCVKCDLAYFTYITHICPKKQENLACPHCFIKFQHQWQLDIHTTTYSKAITCRICCESIKKCHEPEHMLQHSKNYIMAFQCKKCQTNVWFRNYESAKMHWKIMHNVRVCTMAKGYRCVSIYFHIITASTMLSCRTAT